MAILHVRLGGSVVDPLHSGPLDTYTGYESATEGDAFILAFHGAEDAAKYAVAVQVGGMPGGQGWAVGSVTGSRLRAKEYAPPDSAVRARSKGAPQQWSLQRMPVLHKNSRRFFFCCDGWCLMQKRV